MKKTIEEVKLTYADEMMKYHTKAITQLKSLLKFHENGLEEWKQTYQN